MKIQNISGVSQLFSLGRRAVQLTPNEIITIDEDEKTVAAVMVLANAGSLKVVEGPASASFSRTAAPKVTFGLAFGALTRWADGDSVKVANVIFEADTNSTRTVAGSNLVDVAADIGVSITAVENKFITAFSTGAGKAALAAVGVKYLERVTIGSVVTLMFELDTARTAQASAISNTAFTNAGGSGTAPSVVHAAAVSGGSAALAVVDVVVPAGQTAVVARLPYRQILGVPEVTVRDSGGVVQTYSSANVSVTGVNVKLVSLTAGHTATIVVPVR